MDKIVKYKFWILSSLVLPLALAGFFMANGQRKSATAERVTQLEGITAPNANQPNDTHTAAAKLLADQQEAANAEQLRQLDAIQRQWVKWPDLILRGLELNPETGELVYRGEQLRNDNIRVQYPDEYQKELERVWLAVNPVVPNGLPFSDKSKKKVFCPPEVIPAHPLTQTPTVEEIWDAQEDLWILEMLFTAVNATNQAATDVNDAAIREIMFLELFGGTGESSVVTLATGGESGSDGGEVPYQGSGAGAYSGSSGAGGAGGAVPFADGKIGYDHQEEYGSQADAGAAAAEGSSAEGDATALFGSGASAAAKPLRYIQFDPAAPGDFRKRGFYISLLIQEKKIPDFIVSLANLDPPIYTGRWGFANNPYDTDHLLTATLGGAGGGGAASYSGSDYGGAASFGGGGGGGSRAPRRSPQAGSGSGSSYGSEFSSGAGSGAATAGLKIRPYTNAQLAELTVYEGARLGKDLVQLEISGVVTIFTPNVPAVTPADPATAAPADASTSPPADVAIPTDSASPSVDPNAPPVDSEAPAAETPSSTEPTPPPIEPTPPTSDPAAAPPAADAPPPTETPTPPPATEPPATEVPATEPPAETPPADSAPPAMP